MRQWVSDCFLDLASFGKKSYFGSEIWTKLLSLFVDDYLATTVNDENLTCEIGEKRLICNNYLRSGRPKKCT